MLCLSSCGRGLVYTSAVPNAPVQISINTKDAFFVHFIPDNVGQWLIVDKDGFHLNGKQTLPRTFADYYGYAGLVIVVNCYSQYSAYDLCCPNCLDRNHPIEVVDGTTAVCPICGEVYNLAFGLGDPTKGICKEYLRRYSCMYSGDRLTVRN